MSDHDAPPAADAPDAAGSPSNGPQIHVEKWESMWMRISLVTIVIFVTALTIAAVAGGIQVPGKVGRVDPNNLDAPGSPFANPGLRELAPGKYEAYLVAQAWAFTPSQITVPQGSQVTFYATSRDIQHGFRIMNTNANVMLLPGQISRVSAVFKEPGTYNLICHEYCGLAHQTMFGQIIVESAATTATTTAATTEPAN